MPVRSTDHANKGINMTSGVNTPSVPISLRLSVLCARQWNCAWGFKTGAAYVLIPVTQAFCNEGECASRIYIRLCTLLILCGVTFHLSYFFYYKQVTNELQPQHIPRYHATTLPCVIYRFKSFTNLHLHPNAEFSGLRLRFTSRHFGMYAVYIKSCHC
jgi:hypothetical protein